MRDRNLLFGIRWSVDRYDPQRLCGGGSSGLRGVAMIDWTKGLTPEEIEFYKKMREEQQEAKKKGVKGEIDLILKNVEDGEK